MRNKKIIPNTAFLLLLFLLFPFSANAYLDAGSGSYVIQIIVATFVGGAFAVKMFFKQIKSFFVKVFTRRKKDKIDDQSNEG